MRYAKLIAVVAAAVALAGPAAAQNSPCAALPQSGLVPGGGGPAPVPPAVTPAGLICPEDYRLRTGNGVPPLCVGNAPQLVQGNPRAACYAALPFGPMAVVTSLVRPVAGRCATRVNILPIKGRGAGFDDAMVTITPAIGSDLIRLTDTGPRVSPSENPVDRRCVGPDCRLMRLTTTAAMPSTAVLRIALPGRPAISRTLSFAPSCPTAPMAGCAPVLACTGTGPCPARPPTC